MPINYTNQNPQAPVPGPVPPMPSATYPSGNYTPAPAAPAATSAKPDPKELRNQMQPNEYVLVQGTLMFSHLVRRLEGDALAKENARIQQFGRNPYAMPVMKATLMNPKVIYKDPNQPTAAELYTESTVYISNSKSNPGPCMNIESQAKTHPYFAVATDETAKSFKQVYPKDDPANGTPAIIVYNTYSSHSSVNRNINGVLILTPEPTWGMASGITRDTQALINFGITLQPTADPNATYDENSPEAAAIAAQTNDMGRDMGQMPFQQPSVGLNTPAPATAPMGVPAAPVVPNFAAPQAPATAIPWNGGAPNGGIVQ